MIKDLNEIDIVPCTADDCRQIVELGRLVWGDYASGLPLSRQIIDLGHPIFLAKHSLGMVVGYIVGVRHASEPAGHVFSIAIHPDYRGRKVGHSLVNHLIDTFRDQELKSIGAMIDDNNEASQRLFGGLGFKKYRDIKNYYEEGDVYGEYKLVL